MTKNTYPCQGGGRLWVNTAVVSAYMLQRQAGGLWYSSAMDVRRMNGVVEYTTKLDVLLELRHDDAGGIHRTPGCGIPQCQRGNRKA